VDEGHGDEQREEDEPARDEARRHENAEAIKEVIDGFEEELVDETIPNFLTDLVVFVERADEELQNQQSDEVRQGLSKIEAANVSHAFKGRTPKDKNDGEMEERKEAADGKVPAVNQITLQADEERLTVFDERGEQGKVEKRGKEETRKIRKKIELKCRKKKLGEMIRGDWSLKFLSLGCSMFCGFFFPHFSISSFQSLLFRPGFSA